MIDVLDSRDAVADDLADRYGHLEGINLLWPILTGPMGGRIALVSSFGTESALLLAMVAEVAPSTPVIFLDTLKHFPETLEYRDQLVAMLGLRNVRSIRPEVADLLAEDPKSRLYQTDPDRCCHIRKVKPLQRVLNSFDGWITGRKRFQGAARSHVPAVEFDGRHIKINPLSDYTKSRIDTEWTARGLPEHPLVPYGYLSVGCLPCTQPVAPGGDARSGRWAGLSKTECGIHMNPGDGI